MTGTPKRTTMHVEQLLPCGCLIGGSLFHQEPVTDASWIPDAAAKLGWLLTDRIPRHDCALVSDGNPNGTTPRVKK